MFVYGTVFVRLKLRGFSWKLGICDFALRRALVITPWLRQPDLPSSHAYALKPGHPTPVPHNLLRPPIASHKGIGLLTDFPSATPFGLTLGSDSPGSDERRTGNLGLSASRFFTCFIATRAGIIASASSSRPHGRPSTYRGMLPYHSAGLPTEFAASVVGLSPVELSAQNRLTSELLRTL